MRGPTGILLVLGCLLAGCASPQPPAIPTTPSSHVPISSLATAAQSFSFEDAAWEARIQASFGDVDCPPPRPHNASYYDGPLVDAHFHIQSMPDSTPRPDQEEEFGAPETRNAFMGVDITFDEIACMFHYEGTTRALAFFAIYPDIATHALELANRTMTKFPSTFYPFIMPPDSDNRPDGSPTVDAEALRGMLAVHPGLFDGYGEIGLYPREGGSPELPPDTPRLQQIYPVVRENGLAVYFHLGEGHGDNWENVLAANPDIRFIWHGDQLPLDEVEGIISRHPNVVYGVDELYGDVWLIRNGVTKEQFFEHFRDFEPLLEKDVATWKALIERHPDQFIWGTDRGVTIWALDRDVGWTLNEYGRAFIARLDAAVQERFAHENVERIFVGE